MSQYKDFLPGIKGSVLREVVLNGESHSPLCNHGSLMSGLITLRETI